MEELRSLVTRAYGGDPDAYGRIVRRFQDMAYGYAYSILSDFHLAEDAAQEAFIEGYRCLSNLRNPAAFPGWFRRIVFKHCDRLRRKRHICVEPLELHQPVASDRAGPVEKAEKREMADRVLNAVRSLPEKERTVTTLFYINGYSQNDIAQFLEVPVTTVCNRLRTSRKRLKERIFTMVAKTLKEKALPEGFDEMIKKQVLFPETEPEINISRAEPRRGSITFTEGAWFFVPLKQKGQSIVAWYDWPERRLSSVGCMRVVGRTKVAGMNCFRVRMPEFDPEQRLTYDHEWYWAVKGRKTYLVALSNFEPGKAKPMLKTWNDRDWDEGRTGWPIELKLTSRVRWHSVARGDGPRFPRVQVAAGLWDVRLGDVAYECLRTLTMAYKGRRKGETASELAAKYVLLADCYISMKGRTVLFRRYNGPAWAEGAFPSSSVGALARKGCPPLRYNEVEFRLWYDCIPLHALEAGKTKSD